MLIEAIHDSPIGVDRAQPIIQQYLVNTRNAKALDEHLKQARALSEDRVLRHGDRSRGQPDGGSASERRGGRARRSGAQKPPVSLN